MENFIKPNSDNSGAPKKILAVDDSGAMLRQIKNWLGGDYSVKLAKSGFGAIKQLLAERPDLILLDYEMPVCDGPQLFRMIKSEEEYSAIPVIFLTGVDDAATIAKITALEPDGYLVKTLAADEIKKAIRDFFAPSQA